MISSGVWKESSPMNSVSTARRSWPRSRAQRAISPASSRMYSASDGRFVTGSSWRGHRTWVDYTLAVQDGPPAAAPFVGEPDAAGGWTRKGRLLTQERFGVLACEAGHDQQFHPFLASGNCHRDDPVVHLGELGRTARTERDHADASGLAEVLACNRHLVTSLAFVRRRSEDRRVGNGRSSHVRPQQQNEGLAIFG